MMKNNAYEIFHKNIYIDENGWTDIISIEDLLKISDCFKSNNGCQWARKGSKFDNTYNIKRFQAHEMGGKGNRITHFQLQGFKEKAENHSIPTAVRKALKDKPCVVLGVKTSDMEIDHKNGKYNSEEYSLEDFQPMSKAVNDAKREHCKKCNASGKRFKASCLGFTKDFYEGDEDSPSCIGCFWYDPIVFRSKL